MVDRASKAVDVARVYVDSSVYGGAFDTEFAGPTLAFFERVRAGHFRIVVSSIVYDEMLEAPSRVRSLFEELRRDADTVDVTEAAVALQKAYLRACVVGPSSDVDALHVALATVSGCQLIVSWNFRHIVNFRRIPLYNGINVANGFAPLGI
jgi:predicted nucleic acid-binding protein